MRSVFASAAFLLTLFVCTAAYGDTVFNLQGTLQDGTGTFSGTIVYLSNYQSYGRVTGTIKDGAFSFTVPSSYLGETIGEGGVTHVDVFSVGAAYDLSLYLPNSILLGNAGGALCSLSMPCIENGVSIASTFQDYDLTGNPLFPRQAFQTITATPQVTPEPGTFVLLGTGMLTMASAVRRRNTGQSRSQAAG